MSSPPGILLVDDEPALLDLLRVLIASQRPHWRVELAGGAGEALERLAHGEADVIVADRFMPGLDGVALLEEVRRRHPGVARLVMSGWPDPGGEASAHHVAHQYLAKPEDLRTLTSRLDRILAVRAHVGDPELRAVVAGVRTLPSPPATYFRLRQACAARDVSAREVAEIVREDPAVAAKLLQLCNAGFLGLRQRVSNLLHAVQLLGLDTVTALVLSSQLFSACDRHLAARCGLDRLWRHSLATSRCASAVAQAAGALPAVVEDARVAGLLHGVGAIVLAVNHTEAYAGLVRTADARRVSRHALELERFGAGQAAVGAYLLGLWGLPWEVVEAVAFHPAPGRQVPAEIDALTILHVAESLAGELRPGDVVGAASPLDEAVVAGLPDGPGRIAGWREACRALLDG